MENINKITNTELIDTKEREELRGQIVMSYLAKMKNPFVTLSVLDVSKDLHIGINQAYDFPAINIGKRKVITLASYLLWKMNKKGGV